MTVCVQKLTPFVCQPSHCIPVIYTEPLTVLGTFAVDIQWSLWFGSG